MSRWVTFAFIATVSIGVDIFVARDHASDPTRCAGLVAMGTRCCAEGQEDHGGYCDGRPQRCPAPLEVTPVGCVARLGRVAIAGGILRMGPGDWEAEGRIEPREVNVAPFFLDATEITQKAYEACWAARRCSAAEMDVRSYIEPGLAQGSLSRADVEKYCAFRGGRLPTADEWAWAAAGASARRYPWGDTGAVCRRASWGLNEGPCALGSFGPELAASHPEGATPEGVYDLAGNVAEWVAGNPTDTEGVVRGGSFASRLATDLRTWRTVRLPVGTRSREVGGRCAYDAEAPAP